MPARTRPAQAIACNDNGTVAIGGALTAPRDVLTAARSFCPRLALLYMARGSLLVTADEGYRRVLAAA